MIFSHNRISSLKIWICITNWSTYWYKTNKNPKQKQSKSTATAPEMRNLPNDPKTEKTCRERTILLLEHKHFPTMQNFIPTSKWNSQSEIPFQQEAVRIPLKHVDASISSRSLCQVSPFLLCKEIVKKQLLSQPHFLPKVAQIKFLTQIIGCTIQLPWLASLLIFLLTFS